MKMQLKSMLLLIGASLIAFTECKKSDALVAPSAQSFAQSNSQSINKRIEVWMTTTTLTVVTISPTHVLKTGTFVASQQLGDTGTYVMDIRFFGPLLDSIHCNTTFMPLAGDEFTTGSKCSIVTNLGLWKILFGSGVYANLSGNGTVTMIPGHEMATGKIVAYP
jgi:hypothetical protein